LNAALDDPLAGTAVAELPITAELVLFRYALPNPTPKSVRDHVGKLLGTEMTTAQLGEIQSELRSAGFLSKGTSRSYAATDAGRERALRFLGLIELPPRLNWATAVSKHLFPKAIGMSVEAAAKLDNKDKLAAYMLKRKYGLPSHSGSSLNPVLEAIVCKLAGYPQETTLAGLLRAVLSKEMNAERLEKEDIARQLPLYGTGLSTLTADAARRRFVREWLQGAKPATRSEGRNASEPFDLPAFAATVRTIAGNSPPEARFYDNKVFIEPLWKLTQREPSFPRMSLLDFKRHLLDANSRHLLHLSRADLVQAMEPRLVAESEIAYLNATFHFVLLEENRS
jgi:hypothetical protein